MAGSLSAAGDASRRRVLAAAALVGVVTAAHLLLGEHLLQVRLGDGMAAGTSGPRPIEVAFVRELAAKAPPAVAAPRATAEPRRPRVPRPARVAARPPAAPASAPEPELRAQAPIEPAPPPATMPEPELPPTPAEAEAEAASAPDLAAVNSAASAPSLDPPPAAVAAASAAASAPSALAFDWPPSTRLSYRLQGYYRGDAHGSASVEWRRDGTHYQVQLEARVGPAFAPLMVRRILSDGEITEAGLAPRRFDAEQRVAFSTRRWSLRFEPERIVLADGSAAPPAEGVQDEASQFVQLSWLFASRPHLLRTGQQVTIPLVLRRRVDRWIYDVVGEQALELPFGTLPAMHLKPRRSAVAGGDMVAQIWLAPTLQYLPVRILIHQDAQTFVDLMLEAPPRQAEPGAAPAEAPR